MSTVNLSDDDMYVLTDGSAWIDVKGFAIRIHSTDEGVVVDIFNAKELETEPFIESLASTYAFDAECEPDKEEVGA